MVIGGIIKRKCEEFNKPAPYITVDLPTRLSLTTEMNKAAFTQVIDSLPFLSSRWDISYYSGDALNAGLLKVEMKPKARDLTAEIDEIKAEQAEIKAKLKEKGILQAQSSGD